MLYQLDLLKESSKKQNSVDSGNYLKDKELIYTFGKFDYIRLRPKDIDDFEDIRLIYDIESESGNKLLKKTFILYSENNDIDFFDIENEYLFFSFLDLTDKLNFRDIENLIVNGEKNIRIFKTIDSFNALVCIKTSSYQLGEEFILKLNCLKYKNEKIVTYSYSIFASNPYGKGINDEEKLIIDMHLRINDFSEYAKFKDEIKFSFPNNNVSFKHHLGVSDMVVHYNDITMKIFIEKVINSKLLSNFQIDFISSTNTRFAYVHNDNDIVQLINSSKLLDDCISYKKPREFTNNEKVDSIDILKKKINKSRKKIEFYSIEYYSTIIMILDSLEQMEKSLYTNFLYKSIISSMNLFVNTISNDEFTEKNILELMSENRLCEYIKGIESVIQCSSRSILRNFDEPLNFNTVHYVPPMLITFYNLLLMDMTKAFDEEHKFLISPTFDTHVKVMPIFDNILPRENRVLLILVPNKLFFNPKELLPLLIHEVGHYFGASIKDRTLRQNEICKCLVAFLRVELFEGIEEYIVDEEIMNETIQIILDGFCDYLNKGFKKVMCDKENDLYLDILIPNIKKISVDYFASYKVELVEKMMSNFISHNYSKNILQWKKVFSSRCDELIRKNINSKHVTLEMVLDAIEDIYRESYSDIFSIKILNIQTEEDIDYIFENCLNHSYFANNEPDYVTLRKDIVKSSDCILNTSNEYIIEKFNQLQRCQFENEVFRIYECYKGLMFFLNNSINKFDELNDENLENVQKMYKILCSKNVSTYDKLQIIDEYVNYKEIRFETN